MFFPLMAKHSKDYVKLKNLLHFDGYILQRFTIKPTTDESEFALKKNGDELIFQSKESDVAMLGMRLKVFPDMKYKDAFKEVKDLTKYFGDIEFLVDLDKRKLQKAKTDLESGIFKFQYDPLEHLEIFLDSTTKSSSSFNYLKKDHHHIIAYVVHLLLKLQQTYDARCALKSGFKVKMDFLFQRAMEAIHSERPIDSYLKLMALIDYDPKDKLSEYVELMAQNNATFETMQKSYGGKTKAENVMHLLLDIYRKLAEFSRDYIRTFAKIEHVLRNVEYNSKSGFCENYNYLNDNPGYQDFLKPLDPDLRNSESHLNTIHNKVEGKLIITKRNRRHRETIREYSYKEFSDISNNLNNNLVLELAMSISLCHMITLFRVINSYEYKMLLLSIDNTA